MKTALAVKGAVATLALTTALTMPALAVAKPVTLTTSLNDYGGDGAYLAVYVTDAQGAYVGTVWMAGGKSKYYQHLTNWHRATGGSTAEIDGITGASVGAGRTLETRSTSRMRCSTPATRSTSTPPSRTCATARTRSPFR